MVRTRKRGSRTDCSSAIKMNLNRTPLLRALQGADKKMLWVINVWLTEILLLISVRVFRHPTRLH